MIERVWRLATMVVILTGLLVVASCSSSQADATRTDTAGAATASSADSPTGDNGPPPTRTIAERNFINSVVQTAPESTRIGDTQKLKAGRRICAALRADLSFPDAVAAAVKALDSAGIKASELSATGWLGSSVGALCPQFKPVIAQA